MKERKTHYAWKMLFACCFLMMAGPGIILNCFGVFFAPVANDTGIPMSTFTLTYTVKSLLCAFIGPFAARMNEKYNIKVVISLATIVSSAAYAAMGLCNTFVQFLICNAISGAASAFYFMILSPTLIGNWFKNRMGLAMGISSATVGVSAMIMNPVCAALIESCGWRLTYPIVAGISCVLVLIVTIGIIRYKPSDMGMLPYGVENEAAAAASGKVVTTLEGLTAKNAHKKVAFWALFMVCGFCAFVGGATQMFSAFGTTVLGLTPVLAATLVSATSAGQIVGNLTVAPLADRFSVRTVGFLTLLSAAFGMLIMLVGGSSYVVVMIGAALVGIDITFLNAFVALVLKENFGTMDYGPLMSEIMVASSCIGPMCVPLISAIYEATNSYVGGWIMVIAVAFLNSCLLLYIYASGKKFKKQKEWETKTVTIG